MVGSCKLPPPSVIPVSEASPEATCPIHIPAMVDGMRRPSAPRFFSSSAQPTTTTVYFSPAPEVPYPLGMKLDSPRISIGMDMQITATPFPSAVACPRRPHCCVRLSCLSTLRHLGLHDVRLMPYHLVPAVVARRSSSGSPSPHPRSRFAHNPTCLPRAPPLQSCEPGYEAGDGVNLRRIGMAVSGLCLSSALLSISDTLSRALCCPG